MDVLLETFSSQVAVLRLNRPQQRNALSTSLLSALQQHLQGLLLEPPRALILTGVGEEAFSAGADLKERQSMSWDQLSAHTVAISAVADALEAFPVPVLAAVRGFCLAGGAELALACDMRVAAPDARFGFPEVGLGIFPGAGGPVRLPRLIGPAAAASLLFTGRRIDAREALQMGLIQALVEDPLQGALQWAEQIAAASPRAVQALKRALLESQDLSRSRAAEVVLQHRRPLDSGPDYREGLAAFAQKRKPVYP